MNDFSTEGAQVVLGLFIQWSTLSLVESSYVKSSLVIYHLSYHLTTHPDPEPNVNVQVWEQVAS